MQVSGEKTSEKPTALPLYQKQSCGDTLIKFVRPRTRRRQGVSQNLGEFALAGLPNPAFHGLDLAIQTEPVPKILDRPAPLPQAGHFLQ